MSHTAGRSTLHFVWRIVSPLEFIIEHQPGWSAQDFYFVYLRVVVELKKVRIDFCPGCVFFCRAGADGRVFVLRGCSQNVPPLMAANGRCACLCINQGAVNLPFNRWGSRASNYFCIVNAQTQDCVQGQRPHATYSAVKTCSHSTVSLLLSRLV